MDISYIKAGIMKFYWEIIKGTFKQFVEDDPMSHSAAISYYTIFSLPATITLIISILAYFFKQGYVTEKMFDQIGETMGSEASTFIYNTLENASQPGAGIIASVISIVMLIFSATSFVVALQTAMDSIWKIKAQPKKELIHYLLNRLLLFILIASIGLVMALSILADVAIIIIQKFLNELLPGITSYLIQITNLVLSLVIMGVAFAMIFKYLPHAKINFKLAWKGGLLTAFLFTIGKLLIGLYISYNDFGSSYGASSSAIALLVWIFYSSLILLIGAEFTKVYAQKIGQKIIPADNAIMVKTIEVKTSENNEAL